MLGANGDLLFFVQLYLSDTVWFSRSVFRRWKLCEHVSGPLSLVHASELEIVSQSIEVATNYTLATEYHRQVQFTTLSRAVT